MSKVSIIVPTFNHAAYIAETLDSVLVQTYADWECIVVDDGSTDKTKAIVDQYCAKDARFTYIYQENAGPSAARNTGIKLSSGAYILPLDADDMIAQDYITNAVNVFENNERIKLVYCLAEFFGEKTGLWNLPEYDYDLLRYHNMIFCTALYKRDDYDLSGGYNENMRDGLEDWDFLLSLLTKDDVVYRIPKVHFFYRIKVSSRNFACHASEKSVQKIYQQIYRNHREIYEQDVNPIFCKHEQERLHQSIAEMQASKFWKLRRVFLRMKKSCTLRKMKVK